MSCHSGISCGEGRFRRPEGCRKTQRCGAAPGFARRPLRAHSPQRLQPAEGEKPGRKGRQRPQV